MEKNQKEQKPKQVAPTVNINAFGSMVLENFIFKEILKFWQ